MSKTTLSKCLVAKNGKQLTSYTFSTMECLLWWAFTPVKVHPLQDFGPYGEWTFAPGGPLIRILQYIGNSHI